MGRVEITTKPLFKGEVVYLKEKGDKNMSLKIKADRVRMYGITGIQALKYEDLPLEYAKGIPRVHMSKGEDELTLVFNDNGEMQIVLIRNGDMISEYDYVSICEQIELAGDKLHKINHKNDKKKTDNKEKEATEWTGSYTFEA